MRLMVIVIVFLVQMISTDWMGGIAYGESGGKSAYIIQIKTQIDNPLFYMVRRGIKEAMEAKADILILDMKTPGGGLDETLKIIDSLERFQGLTVTYVNNEAISAGAFISYGTKKIYMSPRSVIGASAPIMGGPVGMSSGGEIPDTLKQKVVSMIRAQMRACAERNNHNPDVIEAMIDPEQELIVDGVMISAKGELLTLTNEEASRCYGNPSVPLLSSGTIDSLEELYKELNVDKNRVVTITPLGVEKIASWISNWSAILILVGMVALFLEFKTPGFGIFGIVGISALAIYFIGNHIAGLGGLEWLIFFVIGVGLVVAELFFIPGFGILGAGGLLLMFASLVMGMVDFYPSDGFLPDLNMLKKPLANVFLAIFGMIVFLILFARFLPKTSIYAKMISSSVSGAIESKTIEKIQQELLGKKGISLSILRPSGKALIEGKAVDVIAQSDMIEKGKKVQVVSYSGVNPVVEEVK